MESKTHIESPFAALYDAVQKRPRPEDVADLIEQRLPMSETELSIIQRASRSALRHHVWVYSSMASDFLRPASAEKQVKTASVVFSKDG